jgi:hypothetical protein
MITAIVLCAAVTVFTADDDRQVVCEWKFSDGLQGWEPNGELRTT